MFTYQADFKTSIAATDDQITNNAREVVARCGYQVGNCQIIDRNKDTGTCLIDIDDSKSGKDVMQDDIIMELGNFVLNLVYPAPLTH